MDDQQQMVEKFAVWNRVVAEAIWRECWRAAEARSLESRSGRRPWAVRVLLIFVSSLLSRVVTAPAGAAPTRAVDAVMARAASRDSMMRCVRTVGPWAGDRIPPCGPVTSPRPRGLSLIGWKDHKPQKPHLAHLDRHKTDTWRHSQ